VTLATPLALWTLAALAPLVALYALHLRRRPVEVSSLMLWQGIRTPSESGRKLQHLQTPLSLLLEILAILALALLAAGPLFEGRAAAPLVVILDDSVSMRATDDEGLSTRDRARARLDEIIETFDPSSITVVLAGPAPEVLTAEQLPAEALSSLDRSWHARRFAADLGRAVALAREVAAPSARLLVLTDAPPPEDFNRPANLRWVSLGEQSANIAITTALRAEADGETDELILEVTNLSARPVVTPLTVAIESESWLGPQPPLAAVEPFAERELRIAAGDRATLRVGLPATDRAAVVRVAGGVGDGGIVGENRLSEDDAVTLVPVRTAAVRVRTAFAAERTNAMVLRAVESTARARPASANTELFLTDGDAAPREGEWAVRFRAPAEGNAATRLGPYLVDRSHPLAEGLDLAGVRWVYEPGWTPPGGVAWAFVGRDAVAFSFPGRPGDVTLNVDLERSTLAESAALPVLLWNVIAERAAARPGPSRANVAVETAVSVGVGAEGGVQRLPGGETAELPASARPIDVPVVEAGVHVFEIGAEGAREIHRVAVNPTHAAESDLRRLARYDEDEWPAIETEDRAAVPLGWLFGLLAAGLAVGHAVLLWSGRREGA
jgi:hypothetical protein